MSSWQGLVPIVLKTSSFQLDPNSTKRSGIRWAWFSGRGYIFPTQVCQCLYNIYKVTVPHDLLSWKQPEEPPGFHSSSLSIDSVHSSHSDAVIINVSPQVLSLSCVDL